MPLYNNSGNVSSFSIGGHITNDSLDALFNNKNDVGWTKGKQRQNIIIPDGMTDKEFATNIINESLFYNQDQKEYALFSADDGYDIEGNCHNFSTTMLLRASNYSSDVLSTTKDFNPTGANPGLGEYFAPVCTE